MKGAGVTGVIVKGGGSNNDKYPAYLETVHQANARTVFGTCAHYWANGQADTPASVAKKIVSGLIGPGFVKAGEYFGWDVETWPNEAREWTPAEVAAYGTALAAEGGTPLVDQFVYLSLSQLRNYDWTPVVKLGIKLWLAAWDSGPVLARYWRKDGILWRQYTSASNAAIRKVYDADLDLNRLPSDVWTTEELQAALKITVDNVYGPQTTAAVRTWQLSHGLVNDGDAGPKTLATLTKTPVVAA